MSRTQKKNSESSRILIGKVGVDTGQVLICDPCYIDSEWKKEEYQDKKENSNFSYDGVSHRNGKRYKQIYFPMGAELGVCADSNGDGTYNIYATIIDNKIKKLEIIFF